MCSLTVSLHDVESGNLSLKGSCHIGIRPVLYDAAVEVLHRTNELSLFQCTVTDDYSGVKQLVVRLKSIVHNSLGSDLGFHALVTDNGANQNIFCICFDGVMSVDVRRYSVGRSLDHNGSTHEEFICCSVLHCTCDSHILGKKLE